jgi:hypothetical protein
MELSRYKLPDSDMDDTIPTVEHRDSECFYGRAYEKLDRELKKMEKEYELDSEGSDYDDDDSYASDSRR